MNRIVNRAKSAKGFTLIELIIVVLLLTIIIAPFGLVCMGGCGDDKSVCIGEDGTDCHTFEQYGLFDEGDKRNPNVEYDVVIGNVIWSVFLVETIAAPVILVGWYLYEPVGPRDNSVAHIPGAK